MIRFFSIILFILPILVTSGKANAESVYIESDKVVGQGYAFYFAKKCLVITASHVVGETGTEVNIFGIDGGVFTGKVVAKDKLNDLALLDMHINGVPVECHSSDGMALSNLRSIMSGKHLIKNNKPRIAWLDRVLAPSGGLERAFVDGNFSYDGDFIRVQANKGDRIFQGDSGAPVWILFSDYDGTTEDTLKSYLVRGPEGELKRGRFAPFLGVFISSSSKGLKIVPPEIVNEFIFGVLAPMNWSDISIKPSNLAVMQRWRGPLPETTFNRQGFLGDLGLNSLGLEIDMGARDFALKSIEIEYTEEPDERTVGRSRHHLPASLWTSSYRPNETFQGRKRYKQTKCKKNKAKKIANNSYVMSCSLNRPKIVRGLKLLVTGRPGTIKEIRLIK